MQILIIKESKEGLRGNNDSKFRRKVVEPLIQVLTDEKIRRVAWVAILLIIRKKMR